MPVRGRVDQLESSYSEILSLLKGNASATASPAATTASHQAQSSIVEAHSHCTEIVSPPVSQLSYPGIIGTDLLPLAECELLIKDYRRMSQKNLPFVVVPESCRAVLLMEERPMLAQAIFTVTSWRNAARQAALQANFLKDLGERYFIRSERSLDLLQALIVYFGW